MRRSWLSRVLLWVVAAVVGGIYGLAGTIGHPVMAGPVPLGLIIAVVSCAAILVAIRTLTGDRGAVVAAGLGMLAMMLLISGTGPGGSVVVEDNVLGRVWMYAVAGIVLLAAAWPSFSRSSARSARPADAAGEARES